MIGKDVMNSAVPAPRKKLRQVFQPEVEGGILLVGGGGSL